jgi:predicted Fe-Mo cluster-binding NifX family protein
MILAIYSWQEIALMKIAIPTFGARVSPRFDCAREIAIVTVGEDGLLQRSELTASDWLPRERIRRLLELGVDTVLCGGIDRWTTMAFQSAGVTVYGWVAGEVGDALDALLQGTLECDSRAKHGGRFGCRCFPGNDDERDRSPDLPRGRRRRRGRGGPRN